MGESQCNYAEWKEQVLCPQLKEYIPYSSVDLTVKNESEFIVSESKSVFPEDEKRPGGGDRERRQQGVKNFWS